MKRQIKYCEAELLSVYPVVSGIYEFKDVKKRKKRIVRSPKGGFGYEIKKLPSKGRLLKMFSKEPVTDRMISIDNIDFVKRFQVVWTSMVVDCLPDILKTVKEKKYKKVNHIIEGSILEIINYKMVLYSIEASKFGLTPDIFKCSHENINKVWKMISDMNSSRRDDVYGELNKIKNHIKELMRTSGNDGIILNELFRYIAIFMLNTTKNSEQLFLDNMSKLSKNDVKKGISNLTKFLNKNWKSGKVNLLYNIFMISNEMIATNVPNYKEKLLFAMVDFFIWDKEIHNMIQYNLM